MLGPWLWKAGAGAGSASVYFVHHQEGNSVCGVPSRVWPEGHSNSMDVITQSCPRLRLLPLQSDLMSSPSTCSLSLFSSLAVWIPGAFSRVLSKMPN